MDSALDYSKTFGGPGYRAVVDRADWPVQLPTTGQLVSQVGSVAPVVTSISTAVASTSPVSTTRRTAERVRRTCADQSTVIRDQTSLTQSAAARRRRLYCGLCRVKLNADRQAEQHYSGKLHARKCKMLTLLNNGKETSAAQSLPADSQVRTTT